MPKIQVFASVLDLSKQALFYFPKSSSYLGRNPSLHPGEGASLSRPLGQEDCRSPLSHSPPKIHLPTGKKISVLTECTPLNSLIRTVVQDVYSFIFKQLIQPMANQDSTIVAFEELKKFKDALNKNADVHFMKKPILRITIDPNGSDEPRKIQIMPADFINGVLLPHARNQIQLVLQHKDVLSPEVYYAVLMLEQRLESNAFLQAVSRGAGKMMESLSFRQEDVAMIFNSLATMALDLKPFYREGQ